MKKISLTLISILSVFQFAHAQWTNVSGTGNYYLYSGNVGIGTATPGNLLTISGPGLVFNVSGNSQFNNTISVGGEINRTGNFSGPQAWSNGVGFNMSSSTYTDNGTSSGSTIPGNAYIGFGTPTFSASNTSVTYTNGYNLYISGAPIAGTNVSITNPYAVYVNSGISYFGGNMIIGKPAQSNPAYLLNVGGSVRANQITVNSTGADFVFNPTYHLIPLANLEKYIEVNHHLPEIVSAKQMQTDGLNVGENEFEAFTEGGRINIVYN